MHVGIANPRWRGKRSRRMLNPQFYVSGKRPMAGQSLLRVEESARELASGDVASIWTCVRSPICAGYFLGCGSYAFPCTRASKWKQQIYILCMYMISTDKYSTVCHYNLNYHWVGISMIYIKLGSLRGWWVDNYFLSHVSLEISPRGAFLCWSLPWRHNGRDGLSNHRHLGGLPSRFFFRHRSKKTSKLPSLGFVREFIDRRIPLTKGQYCGKCFHLMTSACNVNSRHSGVSQNDCDVTPTTN